MAVGADVLDGGGAGEAGDFAHGFDAGVALAHGIGDDLVPVFAGGDGKETVFVFEAFEAAQENDAIETFVVTDGIGATAEDEGGEPVGFGETVGFWNVFCVVDFDDVASGATDAHGGEAGNQDVFVNFH